MKLNHILLLVILLVGVVFVSGCVQQSTTPSETEQEKTKYVCQDGTIVDSSDLCPKTTSNITTSCTENWSCSDWSTCKSDGTQTRTCIDTNDCGTTKNKPPILQTCTYSEPFDKFELKNLMEKDYSCGGYCRHLEKVSSIKYSDKILYIEQGGTFVIPNNQELYDDLTGRAKVVAEYFDKITEKPVTVQLKEIITESPPDYGFKIVTSKTPTYCYSSDNPAICFPSIIYYTELTWDKFLSMSNIEMSYSEWLSITSISLS